VAGTFVYTPSAGTVLSPGGHTLSVTFTPTDLTRYSVVTKTATITVTPAPPVPPSGLRIDSGTSAGEMNLAWDPNMDPGLAGYKIYYGTTPGDYASFTDVGSVTHFTVTGLTPGLTYYFALTAYNDYFESRSYSNAVSAVASWHPGTLDPTFGNGGVVTHNVAPGVGTPPYQGDMAHSVAIDSSKHILVAGENFTSQSWDMVIWRFKETGELDTGFNGSGFVVQGGPGADVGNSIALDASGRILVAGYRDHGSGLMNYDMVIWRYKDDGTLDPDFGTNGTVVSHDPLGTGSNSYDVGNSIALDASGRILVAGLSWNGTSYDMTIWRYLENGTLDPTFGAGGVVAHNGAAGGNGSDYGYSITLDSSGRILVTGFSTNSTGNWDMAIWRYTDSGALDTKPDTGFGELDGGQRKGFVVYHDSAKEDYYTSVNGNYYDSGASITLDSFGHILVTGRTRNTAGNYDMAIWRYNSDGTLDTSFGGTGHVVHTNTPGENSDFSGGSITRDSLGRVLVAGASTNTDYGNMVIWRYKDDGTLDTTFGTGGIVASHGAAGANADYGRSITLDSDRRIIVTGESWNGLCFDMVIWRYLP
jgi:uncharacterized delta-60 repeat protein